MIDWLVDWIVAAGAWVSGLFVSRDAPNFSVIAGMTAIVLVVAFVFFLFVCTARRSRRAGDADRDV
jgi:membrane protein YdbS with pleckstrin-like domain